MSTQSICLTDEQILNEIPQDLEPSFTSSRAPACCILHARGETKRACAIDDCGRRKAGDKYACGFVDNLHTLHCHSPICRNCALFASEAWISRFLEDTASTIENCSTLYLTWVEIRVPCHALPEAVKLQVEESKHSMLSLFPGALDAYSSKHCINFFKMEPGTSVALSLEMISFFAGWTDDGEAVIRLLAWSGRSYFQTIDEIKAAFPYVPSHKIVASHCPVAELPRFIKFLFAPAIPIHPERQADMALALVGVRRLDYIGQTGRKHRKETAAAPQNEPVSDFTAPEPIQGQNAETMLESPPFLASSPQSETPKPVKTCSRCGADHIGRVIVNSSDSWRSHPPQRK